MERLLQRQDAFDQVSENSGGQRSVASGQRPVPSDDTPDATRHCSSASDGGFRWEEVAEGQDLFTGEEQDHLAALVSRGEVDGAELAAKIAIVAAERRNYDRTPPSKFCAPRPSTAPLSSIRRPTPPPR